MVRHQAFTDRTIHTHSTAIVVTCPKCKCSTFVRVALPHIDSCAFENHSCRCAGCASFLVGIIDPSDGQLIVSELEEPTGVTATPSDPAWLS
jgi:hypothetical protein